jgi:RimJ/RimL family protein N-acetyltransferase
MNLREYRADVTLRDGTAAILRAIRPDDKRELQHGFDHLSAQSIYHRFFQTKHALTPEDLRYLTEVDFTTHVALVAEVVAQHGLRPVGVGRFVCGAGRAPSDHAELAFTVSDEFQGRGVATLLLRHLAAIARQLGYRRFVAEVMPDNQPMLDVFQHSGLPMLETVRGGVTHVELTL